MDVPFSDIDINPVHGEALIHAIREYVKTNSGESISLQKVIERTALPSDEVVEVFYALLTLRYLKPTFFAETWCMRSCNRRSRTICRRDQKEA